MRRFALILLALVLFAASACAESAIDLSGLSLNELLELHALVDTVIEAQLGCTSTELPAGLYIGGETIKSGSYIIFTDDDLYGNIAIFADLATYQQALAENNEALATFHTRLSHNESSFVRINEGNVLYVPSPMLIKTANADWMP